MNAVVMDHAIVGAGCIVGALTFIPNRMDIPERKVVVGAPARIVRDVTDDMLQWKTDGTKLYRQLPALMRESWRECEPLKEVPADRPSQAATYKPWRR
jgi:phenylacetic acid degradation protein